MIKLLVFGIFFVFTLGWDSGFDYVEKMDRMIKYQIEGRGVKDAKVISAMRKVQRHLFVPDEYKVHAYDDGPLPIGHGQTISQPYIVAFMTEVLDLQPEDKVLEIGTGSGYQAAILAEIVKEVYTIEIVKTLADEAKNRLENLGYKNINVKCGDGYKGWPERAPFDKIIITAAPAEIPAELINQLKIGGEMIVPVGSWIQELCLITKTQDGFSKKSLMPVQFVPMIKGK